MSIRFYANGSISANNVVTSPAPPSGTLMRMFANSDIQVASYTTGKPLVKILANTQLQLNNFILFGSSNNYFNLNYPLIGGYLEGQANDPATNAAYQQAVANLDAVCVNMYNGYGGASGAYDAIRALNPNIVIVNYIDLPTIDWGNGSALTELAANCNTYGWYLFSNWPSQHATPTDAFVQTDYGGSGYLQMNPTNFTQANATGSDYTKFSAWYCTSFSTSISQNCNGMYLDNFANFPYDSSIGDWCQNGTTISPTNNVSLCQAWRTGLANIATNCVNYYKYPSTQNQIWGNFAQWAYQTPSGGFATSNANFQANITGYNQLLTGGVMEALLGQSYSIETQHGFTGMLSFYEYVVGAVRGASNGTSYIIFQQDENHSGTNAAVYANARYALATCLLGPAYFFWNYGGTGGVHNSYVYYLDEFNFDLGPPAANSMGQQFPAVWTNGIYRRDFANGISLVNGTGSSQTVTLETTFYRLTGSQDPAVNNGAATTSFTMNNRDGLMLSRTPT